MQLREKNDILENFIFRLGELHIVFAMLKVLGKYIVDSGIDRLFIEAGIYGPTTLGQIIEGKHMKRGIEAYFTMYLALSSIHLKEALKDSGIDWGEIKQIIQEKISGFLNVPKDDLPEHFPSTISYWKLCSHQVSKRDGLNSTNLCRTNRYFFITLW